MAGLVHAAPMKRIALPKRMTSKEYWALPEDAPRCELVGGVVYMAPAPDLVHQRLSRKLQFALQMHLESKSLGECLSAPVGVSLPDDTELQPDLLVLGADHPQFNSDAKAITHPPQLVVEILSPSNREHEMRRKFRLYEAFGVQHYWIADPDARSIEAWSLVDGKYQFSGSAAAPAKVAFPPFPELVLELDELMPKVG